MIPKVLATAIRIETDTNSDRIFLVFEVTDPEFKQQVKKDWTQNLEVQLLNQQLVKYE